MAGYDRGTTRGYVRGAGRLAPDDASATYPLAFSADQMQKIAQIQENARERNWTMGQLRAERFRLRSLYNADKPSTPPNGW